MKKKLLFASLLLAGTSFGQGLTLANEPAIGSSASMFLCDSMAPSFSSITGAGVTWDYSAIQNYTGETRTISIVDPTTTPNTANFAGATKAIVIENFLTTYWTSTATERNSPGFVFEEPTFGTVKAIFDQNPQKLAEYEFSLNDEVSDIFEGTLSFEYNGFPLAPDATGTSFSKIDGSGTLKLSNTVTLNNVIRCLTIDTLNTTVPLAGAIQLIRQQYEYYQLSSGNMPVFTHTYAKIGNAGAAPLTEFTVVLSSVEPSSVLSVNENSKVDFSIFPNPAKESLTIKGNFAGSSAKIVDQSGREVMNVGSVNSGQTIQLTDLQKGIYFLVLTTNGSSNVEKFTKN